MKLNPIALVAAALIVAVGAFWYFSGQEGTDAPLTGVVVTDNPAQTEFQSLVRQLQPISFNTDIFSDPRFSALVDITTPIAPEAAGRIDPFAPISVSATPEGE